MFSGYDVSVWWFAAALVPVLILALVVIEQSEIIKMQRQDIKQLKDRVRHGSIKFKRGG